MLTLRLWSSRPSPRRESELADRFYCPDLDPTRPIRLTGPEAHHLARVRRLGVGNEVELFDGERPDAVRAVVVRLGRDLVELESRGETVPDRGPKVALVAACAIPKGERFDWLVEKAVEIGVARLVPLRTARSTVDPRAGKLDRQRRSIVEASKQCGRNRLMRLDPPVGFSDYLTSESSPSRLIAEPLGAEPGTWPIADPTGSRAILIGPEGGFTPEESDAAEAIGWVRVNLGSAILRIETALIVGAALAIAARPIQETNKD